MQCLKNVYGRAASSKKHQRLKDFDLQPQKYGGNANTQLIAFPRQVRGKGLEISLLKDESTRYWSIDPTSSSTTHALPDNIWLKQSIDGFLKSLCLRMKQRSNKKIGND